MATRVLPHSPSLAVLYGKAVLPALPGAGRLQRLRGGGPGSVEMPLLRVPSVPVEARRVLRYRQVCGFTRGTAVPSTYPHVLAFPLQLALMTDPAFPFPPMGLVHVANTITQVHPVEVGQPVDLTVQAGAPRGHPRGQQVTLTSELRLGDPDADPVWREEMVLLRRGRPGEGPYADPPAVPDEAPPGAATWHLGAALGRRYAAVSGDRNPIHLFDVTAKALGFKRHIAHGMWTKARALAEMENRLPEGYEVAVVFQRPLFLPGSARFGAREEDTSTDFGVTSTDGEHTHLRGRVTHEIAQTGGFT